MEKDRAHNIKIDMAESEVNLQHVMQERKHHRHWLKILSFGVVFNNRGGVIRYRDELYLLMAQWNIFH